MLRLVRKNEDPVLERLRELDRQFDERNPGTGKFKYKEDPIEGLKALNEKLEEERDRDRRHKEELLDALEKFGQGVSKINADGTYRYMNYAYADMLGYRPEELLGKSWKETVHPEDLFIVIKCCNEMLDTGYCECVVRGRKKDGGTFSKYIALIRGQTGHYCFMFNADRLNNHERNQVGG